jgi:hypothetical protein
MVLDYANIKEEKTNVKIVELDIAFMKQEKNYVKYAVEAEYAFIIRINYIVENVVEVVLANI